MPVTPIRAGVPVLYIQLSDDPNWISFGPSTSEVFHGTVYKKVGNVDRLKVTLLPFITNLLPDQVIGLRIIMPPDGYGKCEYIEYASMEVKKVKHLLPTRTTPEHYKYVFESKEQPNRYYV